MSFLTSFSDLFGLIRKAVDKHLPYEGMTLLAVSYVFPMFIM